MRSIICSSPSIMSAVIVTARPAPKRETSWRHKVTFAVLFSYNGGSHAHFNCSLLLSVGYAWLPLLKDGRVIMNEHHIPVAANLPAGYLSCQESASKVLSLLQPINTNGLVSFWCKDHLRAIWGYMYMGYGTAEYLQITCTLQHSGLEIKWVDGGKSLFKVSTHLSSTVYTQVCVCL